MVDIDTIGAGGGSIAYVDAGGVFRVGPQSAGADPGPACYGRGGEEPTSTDAQLLLGRLRPDRGLLGGDMPLDLELARAAMEKIAEQLEISGRGGGARRAADPEVRDGAGDRAQLRAARLRPARVHARRRRRRRAAVRVRHRARARDPARARPAAPGDHLGDRPARDRPPARVRRHRAACREDARPRAARRALRRAGRRGRRAARAATASRRTGASCAASPTAATRARATRCASTSRPARSTTPGSQSSQDGFHAAHEREYGHRFEAEIEIVNVRVLGIGRIDELQWAELEAGDGDPSAGADGRARGRLRRRGQAERS